MAHSYKMRSDLEPPVHLPNGSILSDKNKILTGGIYARWVPDFLEAVPDDDPVRMITEDLPNTTPMPVVEEPKVEEVEEVIEAEVKTEIVEENVEAKSSIKKKNPRKKK